MQETQETWVQTFGQEGPLEEGMATHSNILAWRIPWTEEPDGLQSIGSQRVGHDWSNWASSSKLMWQFQGVRNPRSLYLVTLLSQGSYSFLHGPIGHTTVSTFQPTEPEWGGEGFILPRKGESESCSCPPFLCISQNFVTCSPLVAR